jgi:tetratricopeptide (TPR) repeat protein
LPALFEVLGLNRHRILLLSATVMVYSVLTWFRNDLWSRECDFLEDQYLKVPHGTRGMITLSKCYLDKGRDQEAEALLNKAIAIDPTLEKAYINLSSIMVRKQRLSEALHLLKQGL